MGVVCGAFSGLNAHYQLDALAAAFGHLRETAYAHHDDLMRRGLRQGGRQDVSRSEVTGLPVVRLGSPVTTDDVRALEDEL